MESEMESKWNLACRICKRMLKIFIVYCRDKKETPTDSGLSSSPNSSMASGDLREIEVSNAQDIEADVC
ncbi:hypothetical protein BSL78_12959 [Apostichopus japonicus]|uniref:Uncharacterized protein n=1 Tax=Stichopus japonicus TaxID=307972 RepID=A0A2G8KQ78_STIJA|nr:hypothetical protein BSL78_12959 [Apostichopus japonicus]